MGPGGRPRSTLITFSVCSIWRSMSGIASAAVATRISDCRTSSMPATPPASRSLTRSSDAVRESSVRREISSSSSSDRSWK